MPALNKPPSSSRPLSILPCLLCLPLPFAVSMPEAIASSFAFCCLSACFFAMPAADEYLPEGSAQCDIHHRQTVAELLCRHVVLACKFCVASACANDGHTTAPFAHSVWHKSVRIQAFGNAADCQNHRQTLAATRYLLQITYCHEWRQYQACAKSLGQPSIVLDFSFD